MQDKIEEKKREANNPFYNRKVIALLGSIGGTTSKLTLRELDMKTRKSIEIKPITYVNSHSVESLADLINQFLEVRTLSFPHNVFQM